MNEINPRPGACVCVARWDGTIVFNKPGNYDAFKQGETPGWMAMLKKRDSRHTDNRRAHRIEGERRRRDGNRGRDEDKRRAGAHS